MAGVSISLQAPPPATPDDLQYIISRINEQKGGFRNVTEESMEQEIETAAEEAIEEDGDEDEDGEADEGEDVQSKKETVSKAREEMLKQVTQAHQESALALDFISLLLSGRTPVQAGTTLSPFLKQTLPLGSLGAEVVREPEKSEAEREQDEMIKLGWRVQSLNDTASSILKSATRLESEIEKEKKYWSGVLAVKERGWSIARYPREKSTLGVRYGFAEAAPTFRNKGLAALRRNVDGSVSLDRGPDWKNDRITLHILQAGNIISGINDYQNPHNEDSLERDILDARNSIYDQELFYEMSREAQYLASYGVKSIGNKILLPFKNNQQIEIALDTVTGSEEFPGKNEDPMLRRILLLLRLFLSQAHEQTLHDRSKPPPPLQEGNRPRPTHPILKPLVEILQQQTQMASLQKTLSKLSTTLSRAGLTFTSSTGSSPPNLSKLGNSSVKATHITRLLHTLTNTSVTLTLPAHSSALTISVTTTVGPPRSGTTFTLPSNSSHTTNSTTTQTFSSLTDLTTELSSRVSNAVKHYITTSIPAWKDAELGVEIVERKGNAGKVGDSLTVEMRPEETVVRLRKVRNGLEELQGLNGGIGAMGGSGVGGNGERGWVWRADGEGSEERALSEVLEDVDR